MKPPSRKTQVQITLLLWMLVALIGIILARVEVDVATRPEAAIDQTAAIHSPVDGAADNDRVVE